MSCFMIDRKHVRYLIESALRLSRFEFSFWDGQNRVELIEDENHVPAPAEADLKRMSYTEAGQMLWDANLRSVNARYPDCASDNLPGEIDETYRYKHKPASLNFMPDPVQVLKSISCLDYQACEYVEWEGSPAHHFCQCLRSIAESRLPGYEKAAWGAPEIADRDPAVVRLT